MTFADDSSSSSGETGKTYYEACSDATIDVQDYSVLCDSAGAYYYGGSKYRNSEVCKMGDKVKVNAYVYIEEDLDYEPYITVKVDGVDGKHKSFYIYNNEALCESGSIKGVNGEVCPEQGYYKISASGYAWEKDSDSNTFEPKATLGFRSNAKNYGFDLGGANTNRCP